MSHPFDPSPVRHTYPAAAPASAAPFDRQYALWTAQQALDILLAPARQAGVLLFITAGLALLGGSCTLCAGLVLGSPGALHDSGLNEMLAQSGLTAQQLRLGLLVFSGLLLATTALLAVFGFLVRRGGPVVLTLALTLCAVLALLFGLAVLLSLLAGELKGVCIYTLPLGWMVFVGFVLVRALSKVSAIAQWVAYRDAVAAMPHTAVASPTLSPGRTPEIAPTADPAPVSPLPTPAPGSTPPSGPPTL
ncbi:MAG: hypothetical protein ACK4PI_05805 [Tepidisphaerales bacterium]